MASPYTLGGIQITTVTVEPSPPASLPTFVDGETPTGAISGTDGTDGNAVFTLAHAPNPASSLHLIKTDIGSAVEMIVGIHFNLVGLTITYTAGNIPTVGQTHRASYRY